MWLSPLFFQGGMQLGTASGTKHASKAKRSRPSRARYQSGYRYVHDGKTPRDSYDPRKFTRPYPFRVSRYSVILVGVGLVSAIERMVVHRSGHVALVPWSRWCVIPLETVLIVSVAAGERLPWLLVAVEGFAWERV